ncbi:MAG: cell division protein FtsQ/DivIB [Evtepia gabavorous]
MRTPGRVRSGRPGTGAAFRPVKGNRIWQRKKKNADIANGGRHRLHHSGGPPHCRLGGGGLHGLFPGGRGDCGGNERYSQEQILSVASVEMGANMILTPGEQIAQRIYRALPYVDHVEVQKRFPTTLKMVITESQPVAVITGAASAWIVDAKGKLLEQADETQAQEYTKVTGLELLEPEQGAQAQTTPENQAQLDGLTAMTTAWPPAV